MISLASLRDDPGRYDWFQFKPGVKKLILSGSPDSKHVSVLWYGYEGTPGMVSRHHHAKTESVFVIEGAQCDARGKYEKGSFSFNPPGSGHDVFDSVGLFLVSYAAPPDFSQPLEFAPYDAEIVAADYSHIALSECSDGTRCYTPRLEAGGGMKSRFVRPGNARLSLSVNVLLVLQGSCDVAGELLMADTLMVTESTVPASYPVTASSSDCLLYEMAFE